MTTDPNPAIDPLTGQPLVQPDPGYMILYDAITPPLPDGTYMASTTTEVDYDGSKARNGDGRPTPQQRYFAIDGPRFALPADLVASVVPPRNGHGGFYDMLPHIALGRKTLPWERDPGLPRSGDKPAAPVGEYAPPLDDLPVPWVALLLFEEGECAIKQHETLRDHLPLGVLTDLQVDWNTTADFVVARHSVVSSIMPSIEELKLLTHCRQVNVDYKELSAGSSDGYFSVVVSNRLPEKDKKYVACLVSVEQRWDIVPTDPLESSDVTWPVQLETLAQNVRGNMVVREVLTASAPAPPPPAWETAVHALRVGQSAGPATRPATGQAAASAGAGAAHDGGTFSVRPGDIPEVPGVLDFDVSLVLLFSWKFECSDLGTFQDLMQALDVAMMGTVANPMHPPITDSGHLPMTLHDRAGVVEHVLYRGPLVPLDLSRDEQGPYHSADQARRVMPETGVEDISYAAAFEVGRLLGMSDGRLAQELMSWRRTAFHQSARATLVAHLPQAVRAALPAQPIEQLHAPLIPIIQAHVITTVATSGVPAANLYGVPTVQAAPGLDPPQLAAAWGISLTEAQASLGRSAGGITATMTPVQRAPQLDHISQRDADIVALRRFQQNMAAIRSSRLKE